MYIYRERERESERDKTMTYFTKKKKPLLLELCYAMLQILPSPFARDVQELVEQY